MHLLSSPMMASIILTRKCNLKCKHCISSSSIDAIGQERGELSTEEVKNIIEQLREIKLHILDFNGGEIFLREDLNYLIEYSINKGLDVVVTTNGTLTSSNWLRNYGRKLLFIRISLDSNDPSEHDEFRGVKGAFEKTVRTIKEAVHLGITVTVLLTIRKGNLHSFENVVSFVDNMGVAGFSTSLLAPIGRGKRIKDEVLTPEETHEFVIKMDSIRKRLKEKGHQIDLLEEFPETVVEHDIRNITGMCTAGTAEICISSNGYLFPCGSFTGFKELETDDIDIRKHKIIDIYHNAKLFKILQNREEYITGKCQKCPYLKSCAGGCRAMSWIAKKDLFAPDPFCWYEP